MLFCILGLIWLGGKMQRFLAAIVAGCGIIGDNEMNMADRTKYAAGMGLVTIHLDISML